MPCVQEPPACHTYRISKICCVNSPTCAQVSRQSRRIFDLHVGHQPRKSESRQQKMPPKSSTIKTQTHLDATTVTIYTDGSGIEGKIGAAAYNSVTNEASHQYLGSKAQFSVFTTELTAVHLAIKQLWNHYECRTCRIHFDSQAAIKAIDHPRRQSGQTIIKDILESIDDITNEHTHLQLEIIWIPGHAEIEGMSWPTQKQRRRRQILH